MRFIGSVDPDALPAYLRASDVLMTTRISGRNSPLKVLDYLKAGRCILATDIAANRQILDEHHAWMSPAEPKAFAEAIVRLAEDPNLREELAANGRDLLNTRYHYGYFRESIRKVYERIKY